MLKIFNLTRNVVRSPLFCSSTFVNVFRFQTLKTTSICPSLFKFKDLNFKSIKCVAGRRKKPTETTFKTWKIIKGDKVMMISGKDKGKQGIIYRVYRKQNKVLVSGINLKMKRYKGDTNKEMKGETKPKMHPVHISKVSLIDPETGKPAKTRAAYLADGTKVRISKKSGAIIPKPENPAWQQKNRNKKKVDGIHDTPPNLASEATYKGENFDKIKKEFEEYIQKKEKREKLLVFDE